MAPPKRVLVIGELNADLIASGLHSPPALGHEVLAEDFRVVLGSASAIFACGMAKLGHPVSFVSKAGGDDFGEFCVNELRKAGICTAQVIRDPHATTGVTVVLSTVQDRAQVTYLGAIAELGRDNIPAGVIPGNHHLHLTSYFLQHGLRPSFAAIMREARQSGLTVSFDPNSDPAQSWDQSIYEIFAQADILFLNESEALAFTRQANAQSALEALSASAACVALKLGDRGAIGARGRERAAAAGFKVKSVDTTGAGDSFAAGFVHAYLEGQNLQQCLRAGNACGALSTRSAGGTASQPDLQAFNQFLATHR